MFEWGEEEGQTRCSVTSLEELQSHLNPSQILEVNIASGLDSIPAQLCELRNLRKLTLVNGNISLIENLNFCSNLEFLNLSSNMITNIENLHHCTNLKCLVLDYNPISCIKVTDFVFLQSLERLFLCGTLVENLWMTAAALQRLPLLQEVAFCKFDAQHMRAMTVLEESPGEDLSFADRNEREAENILDFITRRIGDMTVEEIGGRIHQLSGTFKDRIQQADWSPLERLSQNFDLPERVVRLGARLESPELTLFGERLQRLSIPATISYLSSLRRNISDMTGSGASAIGNLLNTIQTTINSDSSDFFLDDPSSSSDEEDIDLIYEEQNTQRENFSSPICWERNYTEFFIHSLPQLKVFDGIKISKAFRERASGIYYSSFQDFQWTLSGKKLNSPLQTLLEREHVPNFRSPFSHRMAAARFRKDICGTLLSKYQQPRRTVISSDMHTPRQFEYHPTMPGILLYGTVNGELVVVNTNTQSILNMAISNSPRSILGLCWFHRNPQLFISGSDDGTLNIYNSGVAHCQTVGPSYAVSDLEASSNLTSVHINSTDQYCLSSGFDPIVKLYDLNTGRLANSFKDLHSRHINVLKFAHHDPNMFATSSFDGEVKLWDLRDVKSPIFSRKSNKGNVMVCFSPDDKYILSSAVDNEVRQYTTREGRLHLNLNIKKTHSKYNYTRSYYMNDGDYIIVGSCQEGVVRVYNSENGKFLRDVLLCYENSTDYYCQSLRANPFFPFTFSSLMATKSEYRPLELIEINLLQGPDS